MSAVFSFPLFLWCVCWAYGLGGVESRARAKARGERDHKGLVSRVTYADHILWIVRLHDAMALHSRRFKLYTKTWGWTAQDVVEPKFGRFSIAIDWLPGACMVL